MEVREEVLGIICGGGLTPGLNDVIASATIYARSLGWTTIGFHSGYRFLATGDLKIVREHMEILTVESVTSVMGLGGSILRTGRFDPTHDPTLVTNILTMLKDLHIRYLIIIGGNDKIAGAHKIFRGIDPTELQVIAIPKTIDNDIQLPYEQTTFGFHSARSFASRLVRNLIEDSRSAPRWFVIELMGKGTGHLALSVASATGAHLCIIPEDFGDKVITLKDICDVFEGSIIKRLSYGKNYGVCIISEGLVNKMSKESVSSLYNDGFITFNSDGNIILDDAELSRAIRFEMNKRLSEKKIEVRVNPKKIGYELRACAPVSYDAIYSRELGFGAVEGLRMHHSNCMVIWDNGKVSFKSFRSLMNAQTGEIPARCVDTNCLEYKVAQEYFWKITQSDMDNEEKLLSLANTAKLSAEEFRSHYNHVLTLTNN